MELGLKVNLFTSERAFVYFTEDGTPDARPAIAGVYSEDGNRPSLLPSTANPRSSNGKRPEEAHLCHR